MLADTIRAMNQSSVAPSPAVPRPLSAQAVQGQRNNKLGIWLFLSSELLIFSGLIGAFVLTRAAAYEKNEPWWTPNAFSLALASVNTFLLLLSSLMVVQGIHAIRADNRRKLMIYLTATAILGAMFIGGQAIEWTSLFREGESFSEPFGSAFFILTGLHGLHVVLGVLWCIVVLLIARRGVLSSQNYMTVEVFGLYWHFVDLIWVIIFPVVYLT
jgi:cytochrome c oxidase subunit 3/cytochrome o ubiquinol oxidase subunit 3